MIKECCKEVENIFYYLGCDKIIERNMNLESLFEIKNIIKTLSLIEIK